METLTAINGTKKANSLTSESFVGQILDWYNPVTLISEVSLAFTLATTSEYFEKYLQGVDRENFIFTMKSLNEWFSQLNEFSEEEKDAFLDSYRKLRDSKS